MYLRKAADEPVFSTGAVLAVQAVVERAGVADGHTVQTDIQLCLDAAAQVVAAAGELKKNNERLVSFFVGAGSAYSKDLCFEQ